jgi:nucleoside-diphosphate-sugar epimerase
MHELAARIIAQAQSLFGYRGRLVRQASPEAVYLVDNPNRRCPNLDKSRAQLGYNPTILIDEGIRRALVWYHHNREAEEA